MRLLLCFICLCFFILSNARDNITVRNLEGQVVALEADKSTDKQTGRKVAGMINDEPFFQEDLDVYIAELRAVAAAHYGKQYNIKGSDAVFWDTPYGDSTPREFLNKLALEELVKNMTLIQEARSRGIATPATYSYLEEERAAWNTPTDDIVFGPKTLNRMEYNNYRISTIRDELKTILLQNEFAPTTAQLKAAFDDFNKDAGGLFTFEEAPGLGRNKWINDRFEEFMDNKIENASVTIFSTGLINQTKPIDLSKYTTFIEAEGAGTLKSRGKAADGATTYYVDYSNGNDANDGATPLKAWKTFKNVNLKTFNPGDHILLEANSIWNGVPVDKENYITQAQERGNGGMLAPQGNGVTGNPCVIDLYEIKETANGVTVYWSADRRPIINGNGTPFLNSDDPYRQSGAIHIEGQDYWEIRNMEVTNSFDFPKIGSDPSLLHTHWYKREVPKSLVGILVASTRSHSHCRGILIENCYAHDVQSLHSNNRPESEHDWYDSEHFGFVCGNPGKSGGGILFSVTESVIQGNIVRRTALEGMRTIHGRSGEKIIIRGNYIETVAGDGIVISQVENDNLVESNLVKEACAAPNFGNANYAANWCYVAKNTLYQYNESWGTLYGYLDGEAWDVDLNSDQVIYQYNYSHHNAGGTILFMGNQTNSIFRYNISANDGGGSKYMATVVSPGATPVDSGAQAFLNWNNGQSLIHYTLSDTVASPRVPLVHNNTFYIGDGVSAAIYGNTTSGRSDKYVRFYNNIILKVGAGEVRFSDTHKPKEAIVVGNILNPSGFKNNLLYGYTTDRKQSDKTNFLSGNLTIDQWVKEYGNLWADPFLKIQEAGGTEELRKQRDNVLPETDYAYPEKLGEFTGVGRLRLRASLFTPLTGSPAIEAGMKISVGNSVQEVDGAWNGNVGSLSDLPVHWDSSNGITHDMFANPINPSKPPIGGAVKTYPGK